LTPVHQGVRTLAAPLYWLSDLPSRVNAWGDENLVSRERLIVDNQSYQEELELLKAKVLKIEALRNENDSLRELLNAADRIEHNYVSAQVIGVVPDPIRQLVVLNKGTDDGIVKGMPIVDQFGVIGQIESATAHTATVLLLIDRTHAAPVKLLRSGVRSVVEGSGDISRLNLLFVPLTADVSIGDLVVTSGRGGIFPSGYPVGKVETILRDPDEPFVKVSVRPLARFNRSDTLLAVSLIKQVD